MDFGYKKKHNFDFGKKSEPTHCGRCMRTKEEAIAEQVSLGVPCDDSNWCEYQTYNEGFKLGVLQFPFSLKLHNNYFKELNNYEEFLKILKLVIDYRNDVIKRGWAIKYGFEFQGKEYPELEALSEKELINWVDPRPHARWSLNDARKEWFE